jgi:pseudaminic acid synthase
MPLIVAEMSGNHNHSLDRALEIVDAAAAAGAHALKIQTYTADSMTIDLTDREFSIRDEKSLWNGKSLYELYREAYTPWEWHQPIFERCREHGLIGFSTPFDATAVDFLESLDVPVYKIASFENTDIPLIRKVAATGKPVIISTGMATEEELRDSVDAARAAGCRDLVLLKCTSAYPADPKCANISTIPHIAKNFDCLAGLSDHTMGIGVAVTSVALGAVLIEKHFTLRRADGGVDSAFSLEPAELEMLVRESTHAWQALGSVSYGTTDADRASVAYRRSLYVVKDMTAGEAFSTDNVRAIRPGKGLPPKHLDELLGRKARRPLARGTPLSWDVVD